jgi:hypothetical protein
MIATLIATCLNIAAMIGTAPPGAIIDLQPAICNYVPDARGRTNYDKPALTIARSIDGSPVTIVAQGSTINGIQFMPGSGGITIVGGTVVSWLGKGKGVGISGYALAINGAHDLTFINMTLRDANKGAAITGDARTLRFIGVMFGDPLGDGIIATKTDGLAIIQSIWDMGTTKLQECRFVAAASVWGIGQAPCLALAGAWFDGDHQDAVQAYDGVQGLYIGWGNVKVISQGFDDFTGRKRPWGAAPGPAYAADNSNCLIAHNQIATTGYHSITMGPCHGGRVFGNTVRNLTPGRKSAIKLWSDMLTCGNDDPFDPKNNAPCPADFALPNIVEPGQ